MEKAIVLDAYGTLLDVDEPARAHGARLGPAAASVSATWRAKQLEYTWVYTLAGKFEPFAVVTARALTFALAAHGIHDRDLEHDLLAAYRRLPAHADAAPAVLALRSAGCRPIVLTNGDVDMATEALEAAGLKDAIEVVLSASAVRHYKPHAAVYALAAGYFARPAREIRFVSSNAWDAGGAAAFGFEVTWVNRKGLPPEYEAWNEGRVAVTSKLPRA
jgi:2-haloacid dehalogenase